MTVSDFVHADDIRTAFSNAMSAMYRAEVPLYGALIDIVATVNARVLDNDPSLADEFGIDGGLNRLSAERHGAVRVGTAAELSVLRRAFAVMGMFPVGYYDLATAGVPVHSTAFRPIDLASLNRNPFRIFTSLLRLELIEDEGLRALAARVLSTRRICSDRVIELIERCEMEGGLDQPGADAFVLQLLETFRWQSEALIGAADYDRLSAAHRLLADIVSFKGPHINHLTPRTLDIDAAADEMRLRGMDAKSVIEGPPPRKVPILLRQTSFRALQEPIIFAGQGDRVGAHTARFGEIEQRGIALTPRGRALYDTLLNSACGDSGSQGNDYVSRLEEAFAEFPDDLSMLRREGLAYFRYEAVGVTLRRPALENFDLESAIVAGLIRAIPIIYEDFLPVSAAGIFQSNLGGGDLRGLESRSEQDAFEHALGSNVLNSFELYQAIESQSLVSVGLQNGGAETEDFRGGR